MSKVKSKQRTLDTILNNLKCYLCLEDFQDPRLLNCNHSFCKECLDGYITTVCEDGVLECPLCDSEMKVPEKGARALRKNYFFQLQRQNIGEYCHVCGEEEMANKHCIECNQDFCVTCVKSHSGMTATREHHMVKVGRSPNNGKIKHNLFCKIHPEERLLYQCSVCKELVCQHCNATTHKQHASKYVKDVAESCRNMLGDIVNSDEYVNYLCWLAERKMEISQEINRYKRTQQSAEDEIQKHSEMLHHLVEVVKGELLGKVKEQVKEKVKPIKGIIKDLDRKTMSSAGIFQFAKNVSAQGDDIAVVEYSHKLVGKLEKMKSDYSIPTIKRSDLFYFDPKVVEEKDVRLLFGNVKPGFPIENDPRPELLHDFEIENEGSVVSAILPLSDGRVWVVEGAEGALKLYDNSGRVHRTLHLGLPADDITYGPDNTILVSCNSGKVIKAVDKQLRPSTMLSTPACARGMALDQKSGILYICMTEKNAFFDHDVTHHNKVVKTLTGKNKRWEMPDILEFSTHPTVEYPARVVVTQKSYIAISDWKRECVTVLNKNGHIEAEYYGMKKNAENYFNPRGLCSDEDNGCVYVADYNNSRIMRIDESGQMFDIVLGKADKIFKPWSVAVGQDGSLWVGSQKGKIGVYSLNG
ncbi:E3 ubiquitin-protein ligase TRIM71-like [Saccostrea cucullata]|uniref:E3 ubiquitin-protein ligase TRIM71-like n=1 Tax=Saccostrea cuccullata TaxID=36930 RepID=UPI002ED69840